MRCNHFDAGTCRSCSLLPQPYERQLAGKAEAIAATLSPVPGAGEIAWLAPASSPQKGFRTSAKLVVGGTRRRPTLGILGPDRRGIDLPGCPIQHPAINRATPGLKRFIRSLDLTPYDVPTKRGELKNILITVGAGEHLMIRFVLRTRERVSDIRSALPLLRNLVPSAHVVTANIHPTHEAIVEGPDEIILTRARTLPLSVEGLELGPRSFAQTNAHVASALCEQAALWASRPFADGRLPESLWDLYCGVGGFALTCARRIPARHRRRGVLRGDLLGDQRRAPRGPVSRCCNLHRGGCDHVGARPGARGHARRDRREPAAPRHRSRPSRLPQPVRRAARHLLLVQPYDARHRPGGHALPAPRRGPPLRHVPPHHPRRGRPPPRAHVGRRRTPGFQSSTTTFLPGTAWDSSARCASGT